MSRQLEIAMAVGILLLVESNACADLITTIGVQREVAGSASFTSNITQTVNFNTTTLSSGGITTANGTVATATTAGIYNVGGNLTARVTNGASGVVDAYVLVNGSVVSRQEYSLPSSGTFDTLSLDTLVSLNPGDVVSVQLRPLSGTNIELATSGNYTHASLFRAANSTIGVQREVAGSASFTSNITQTVNFNTTTLSSGGITTANGTVATATTAGIYNVGGNLTARVTNGASGVVDAYVLVNGSVVSRQEYSLPSSGTFDTLSLDTLVSLNPGDVVSVQLRPLFGTNIELATSGNYTHASLTHFPEAIGILRQNSNSISLGPGTGTLTFDTTIINTGDFVATPSFLALATIDSSGLYKVAGDLTTRRISGSGILDLYVNVNGSAVSRFEYSLPGSGNFDSLQFESLVNLNAGDIVSLQYNSFSSQFEVAGGGYSRAFIFSSSTAVPEPSSFLLLSAVAVTGCITKRWTRSRRSRRS